MQPIDEFINRNRNTYQKVSDVPVELINKYKKLLPEELIYIWETMGFGIYEDGFLQLVNPDEYEFVFEYVDKMLTPSIIWGMTALGDLLMWEGNGGWTISPEEGNVNTLIHVRKCTTDNVIGDMECTLNLYMDNSCEDDFFLRETDGLDAKPYLTIKGKLPALKYGECYGYFPALALGGSASVKNLKVTNAKAYIDVIGQAAGKFE
jgi:hypothetical protein